MVVVHICLLRCNRDPSLNHAGRAAFSTVVWMLGMYVLSIRVKYYTDNNLAWCYFSGMYVDKNRCWWCDVTGLRVTPDSRRPQWAVVSSAVTVMFCAWGGTFKLSNFKDKGQNLLVRNRLTWTLYICATVIVVCVPLCGQSHCNFRLIINVQTGNMFCYITMYIFPVQ